MIDANLVQIEDDMLKAYGKRLDQFIHILELGTLFALSLPVSALAARRVCTETSPIETSSPNQPLYYVGLDLLKSG